MRKLLSLFVLLLCTASPLFSEERIAGTLENVDLYVTDLYNDDGHNYGEQYHVRNRNDYPMRIKIQLTDNANADSHLINFTVIVEPHSTADLGYITQKELARGANWKYEWKAVRDSH